MHALIQRELGIDIKEGDDAWMDFAGLAARRNPRRAHLVVSKVLGKHIPAAPDQIIAAGERLGQQVARALGEDTRDGVRVIGYAETATALGHCVAAAIEAPHYAHTTRDMRHDVPSILQFEESHSHAPRHHLCVDPADLAGATTIVLVDDELTTGNTARATIDALSRITPARRFIIAALMDLRAQRPGSLDADSRGLRIEVVATTTARLDTPKDVLSRGAAFLARYAQPVTPRLVGGATLHRHSPAAGTPGSGRHGWTPTSEAAARAWADRTALMLAPHLGQGPRLVLGCEEFMYPPLLVAAALQRRVGDTFYQSTTRSPAAAVDRPDYAIRSTMAYRVLDDPSQPRYLHNLEARAYSDVVLLTEDPGGAQTAAGLLAALTAALPPASRLHHIEVPYTRAARAGVAP